MEDNETSTPRLIEQIGIGTVEKNGDQGYIAWIDLLGASHHEAMLFVRVANQFSLAAVFNAEYFEGRHHHLRDAPQIMVIDNPFKVYLNMQGITNRKTAVRRARDFAAGHQAYVNSAQFPLDADSIDLLWDIVDPSKPSIGERYEAARLAAFAETSMLGPEGQRIAVGNQGGGG